jgi:hypothetical protein
LETSEDFRIAWVKGEAETGEPEFPNARPGKDFPGGITLNSTEINQ